VCVREQADLLIGLVRRAARTPTPLTVLERTWRKAEEERGTAAVAAMRRRKEGDVEHDVASPGIPRIDACSACQ
jgi:hypothetical protein